MKTNKIIKIFEILQYFLNLGCSTSILPILYPPSLVCCQFRMINNTNTILILRLSTRLAVNWVATIRYVVIISNLEWKNLKALIFGDFQNQYALYIQGMGEYHPLHTLINSIAPHSRYLQDPLTRTIMHLKGKLKTW